jgi:molybdopterin converting factor small subunit
MLVMNSPLVTVEFYGVPRAQARRREVRVAAATAAEALAGVAAMCPALAGVCDKEGQLNPHFLLSLDGEHFVTDLTQTLKAGDRLVLLSADAGG